MATTDMESSKAVNPDPVQQDQEEIDAQKKKQEDAKQNAYFNDAQKKQWVRRCSQLRLGIEQLFTQPGVLRHQGGKANLRRRSFRCTNTPHSSLAPRIFLRNE